ncbi:hypothetical protein HZB02_01810 [Candidatus Woesearchaeota archaeon]|nr:hypothetical protein [Candidatus Woesearchaeota archaeon]
MHTSRLMGLIAPVAALYLAGAPLEPQAHAAHAQREKNSPIPISDHPLIVTPLSAPHSLASSSSRNLKEAYTPQDIVGLLYRIEKDRKFFSNPTNQQTVSSIDPECYYLLTKTTDNRTTLYTLAPEELMQPQPQFSVKFLEKLGYGDTVKLIPHTMTFKDTSKQGISSGDMLEIFFYR